jgi:uncharacterized damage-inducible protein DinB
MKRLLLVVVCACVFALPATAQPPAQAGSNAATDLASKTLKTSFDTVTRYLVASAEKMPEAKFAFKATPEVMSFGEFLGHVADTHYSYCARIKGEKNPSDGISFQKKTAKADLVKGLNDSIAYCTEVYAGMTDAKMVEMMAPPAPAPPPAGAAPGAKPAAPPAPSPRARLLIGNVTHDWEHYGNIVTYLRLNGLIPPSSEPRK